MTEKNTTKAAKTVAQAVNATIELRDPNAQIPAMNAAEYAAPVKNGKPQALRMDRRTAVEVDPATARRVENGAKISSADQKFLTEQVNAARANCANFDVNITKISYAVADRAYTKKSPVMITAFLSGIKGGVPEYIRRQIKTYFIAAGFSFETNKGCDKFACVAINNPAFQNEFRQTLSPKHTTVMRIGLKTVKPQEEESARNPLDKSESAVTKLSEQAARRAEKAKEAGDQAALSFARAEASAAKALQTLIGEVTRKGGDSAAIIRELLNMVDEAAAKAAPAAELN